MAGIESIGNGVHPCRRSLLILRVSGRIDRAFADITNAASDIHFAFAPPGSRLVNGRTGQAVAVRGGVGWHIDATRLDLPADAIARRIAPGVLATLIDEGDKATRAPAESGVISRSNGRGRGGEAPQPGKDAAGGGR